VKNVIVQFRIINFYRTTLSHKLFKHLTSPNDFDVVQYLMIFHLKANWSPPIKRNIQPVPESVKKKKIIKNKNETKRYVRFSTTNNEPFTDRRDQWTHCLLCDESFKFKKQLLKPKIKHSEQIVYRRFSVVIRARREPHSSFYC